MSCRLSKRFAILITLALLTLGAAPSLRALNVSVQTPPLQPIPLRQMARVTVTVDGQPISGARIDIRGYVWGYVPEFGAVVASLVTDKNGVIILPDLRPGGYAIGVASEARPNYGGPLRICIVPCAGDPFETTEFIQESLDTPMHPIDINELARSEMRMEVGPVRDSNWLAIIRSAEQQPTINRLSALSGIVQDESGAGIPGSWIDVALKGTDGKRHAALIRADSAGKFSADLPDGDYVAVVSAQGFLTHAIAFAIDKSATPDTLKVRLSVYDTEQTITVALNR